MRTIVLVAIVLLGGCKSSWDDGRYQLTTKAGQDAVYLLDTRTGRVWEKSGADFMPVAIMKDSSSLTRIEPHNKRLLGYEPNTWGDFIQGLTK